MAEGAEFAQKSGADFFETSAKNDENVGRIFTTLVTNVQRKSEAARPAGEARLDAAPPKRRGAAADGWVPSCVSKGGTLSLSRLSPLRELGRHLGAV